MTNREKYRDEIIDLVINKGARSIGKSYDSGFNTCKEISCNSCLFDKNKESCEDDYRYWLDEEYEPTPVERLQAKLEEYTELEHQEVCFDEESEQNMEEYKSCDNCKHEPSDIYKYPCESCTQNGGAEDNWNTDKPKNYIAEFMKENDIKVGEEFEVEGLGTCKITEYDCLVWVHNSIICQETFINLLTGKSKIRKPPKQEYVEVTNDVPRFAEIEVRNPNDEKWEKELFLFKTENDADKYPYLTTNKYKKQAQWSSQARMLKPTEPEFKKGELIEVRDSINDMWAKRRYVYSSEDYYACQGICNELVFWKYARKIEGKQ